MKCAGCDGENSVSGCDLCDVLMCVDCSEDYDDGSEYGLTVCPNCFVELKPPPGKP